MAVGATFFYGKIIENTVCLREDITENKPWKMEEKETMMKMNTIMPTKTTNSLVSRNRVSSDNNQVSKVNSIRAECIAQATIT